MLGALQKTPLGVLQGPAARKDSLWSLFQDTAQPACRVLPSTAEDVSTALTAARYFRCRFTILAGGTSAFRGSGAADGAMTIDLERLSTIQFLPPDGSSTITRHLSVGAGNTWADVYALLDKKAMYAVGTRNSLSGVTGSILGGGISFFSERHGWSCDTVVEFEVVLANGSIVTADETQHPDLFRALRGGGNNFGIVTRVVIDVFERPPQTYIFQLWEGDAAGDKLQAGNSQHQRVTRDGHLDKALDAVLRDRLPRRAEQMAPDLWQVAVTLAWHWPVRDFVLTERTVSDVAHPDAWEPDAADRLAANTTWSYRRKAVLEMAKKMDNVNPDGAWNFFGSITLRNSAGTYRAVADVFRDEVHRSGILNAAGVGVWIVFNPLTKRAIRKMQARGGNVLGLREEDGPLLILNVNLRWDDAADTQVMSRFMRTLLARFRSEAADAWHPYLFQNHAFEEQDVFPGHGTETMNELRAVQREVDPHGIFQFLQPGGFNLGWSY